MSKSIDIASFHAELLLSDKAIIDVRSEGEFEQGHFPGAINLPLLNNEQRHLVGIEYKTNGQASAVNKGFELVGAHFHEKLNRAKEISQGKDILLYCWRGGMRSEIMQWIFQLGGLQARFLEGGYKKIRRRNIELFSKPYSFIRLSGPTATCKTEILELLREKGECVINLEELANHRGSAFGGIGKKGQVSQEQFENILANALDKIPNDCSVWIENESRSIGILRIPDPFFKQMVRAGYIDLVRDFDERVIKIVNEYKDFDLDILLEKTSSVARRMGPEVNKIATEALQRKEWNEWAALLLKYYDKSYAFSDEKNNMAQRIAQYDLGSSNDFNKHADEILSLKKQWKNKS